MRFRRGADVVTYEGEKVGDVDRVVIDPKTEEVSHIIVEKGFLFTTDKVVPVSLIDTAEASKVTLREDAGDLEELPDFIQTHFVEAEEAVEEDQEESGLYWFPPAGQTWWGTPGYMGYPRYFGYPEPPFVRGTTQQIPGDEIALNQGAPVISGDGEYVGDVEEVFTDPESDRVTHILVSKGLLLENEKRVPTTWIKEYKAHKVHLAVGAEVLDRLPDYEA